MMNKSTLGMPKKNEGADRAEKMAPYVKFSPESNFFPPKNPPESIFFPQAMCWCNTAINTPTHQHNSTHQRNTMSPTRQQSSTQYINLHIIASTHRHTNTIINASTHQHNNTATRSVDVLLICCCGAVLMAVLLC
jgi:hypothetical protein